MNVSSEISTHAVVLEQPRELTVKRLTLTPAGDADCLVEIDYSGISTGTERLLWTGRMPPFPGMGYPLVPGYESVGRVVEAGVNSGRSDGEFVFVPGARCYGDVHGLFGGAAARVVVPGVRLLPIPKALGEQGVLMALAATAYHAIAGDGKTCPDLIVGHGVLGRLLARVAIAQGAQPPVVWETNAQRASGAIGYTVMDPQADSRRDYRVICDVSGDSSLLDQLVARLAHGGEIVLAGFYESRLSFEFPPAFMRELRLRVAAEFREADLKAVRALIEAGRLSFDGLITHRYDAAEAASGYETAFEDPTCLKLILDWRGMHG